LNVEVASAPLHQNLQALYDQVNEDWITDPRITCDPILERLTRALLVVDELRHGVDALYANAVCVALVTRLVALCRVQQPALTCTRSKAALPKWRLRRVVEHIDSRLSDCIRLSDMAAAAGLSRMHFAAQFRRATGSRPHEYMLRRRIERAQAMLRDSDVPLVDVALSVGFQTQAHFSTVFKRFAGVPPQRWRQAMTNARESLPSSDPSLTESTSNKIHGEVWQRAERWAGDCMTECKE
jgi:transcriptional regulator GlxA family with amidase domain